MLKSKKCLSANATKKELILPVLKTVVKETIFIATLNNILETADDTLPRVSVSAGISFNEKNKDVKTLFKEADTELYASKKERRCEVHFS